VRVRERGEVVEESEPVSVLVGDCAGVGGDGWVGDVAVSSPPLWAEGSVSVEML
jgi:hypothetical protein